MHAYSDIFCPRRKPLQLIAAYGLTCEFQMMQLCILCGVRICRLGDWLLIRISDADCAEQSLSRECLPLAEYLLNRACKWCRFHRPIRLPGNQVSPTPVNKQLANDILPIRLRTLRRGLTKLNTTPAAGESTYRVTPLSSVRKLAARHSSPNPRCTVLLFAGCQSGRPRRNRSERATTVPLLFTMEVAIIS